MSATNDTPTLQQILSDMFRAKEQKSQTLGYGIGMSLGINNAEADAIKEALAKLQNREIDVRISENNHVVEDIERGYLTVDEATMPGYLEDLRNRTKELQSQKKGNV